MTVLTITPAEAREIHPDAAFQPQQVINPVGLSEIRAFLAARHTRGAEHLTPDVLSGWASDAEFQLREGNPPSIEIPARLSRSGNAEEFTVSPAGVGWIINE